MFECLGLSAVEMMAVDCTVGTNTYSRLIALEINGTK